MKKALFGLVFVLVCLVGVNTVHSASYDHEMEAKGVTFAWKIDGDTLHAKVSAKTKGWVAVGFNPTKKMQDANYIIGFVKGGDVLDPGLGNLQPLLDPVQRGPGEPVVLFLDLDQHLDERAGFTAMLVDNLVDSFDFHSYLP